MDVPRRHTSTAVLQIAAYSSPLQPPPLSTVLTLLCAHLLSATFVQSQRGLNEQITAGFDTVKRKMDAHAASAQLDRSKIMRYLAGGEPDFDGPAVGVVRPGGPAAVAAFDPSTCDLTACVSM